MRSVFNFATTAALFAWVDLIAGEARKIGVHECRRVPGGSAIRKPLQITKVLRSIYIYEMARIFIRTTRWPLAVQRRGHFAKPIVRMPSN